MAIDNTHTKYLKGNDKRAWTNYKDELEAQKKNEDFFKQFKLGAGQTIVVSGNERGGGGNVASNKKKR